MKLGGGTTHPVHSRLMYGAQAQHQRNGAQGEDVQGLGGPPVCADRRAITHRFLCSSKLAQDCSSQSSERHTGAKFVVAPKLVGQQRRDAFA